MEIKEKILQFSQNVQKISDKLKQSSQLSNSELCKNSHFWATKFCQLLHNILITGKVQGRSYFLLNVSDELRINLFGKIFHLEDLKQCEEFILGQLFCFDLNTMQPLPVKNRLEIKTKLLERFKSTFHAIQVEISEQGMLRGFSEDEQEQFFIELEKGSLQKIVYQDEENSILKNELDHELELFGELLKKYLFWCRQENNQQLSEQEYENKRFNILVEIYSYPVFLTYQYFRGLLDAKSTADHEKKYLSINEIIREGTTNKVDKSNDPVMDALFKKSFNDFLISWPTGDDPIYGQEKYLKHFLTGKCYDKLKNMAAIAQGTPLVALVFDISGSMLAHDVKPTRFEYALDLQEQIVEKLENIYALGQVIFSSVGVVTQQFTYSRLEMLSHLRKSREIYYEARLELIKEMFGLTSLGSGLLSAVSLIQQSRATFQVKNTDMPAEIILFTDGDHNFPPNYYPVAQYCKKLGIAIHTVLCAKEICVEMDEHLNGVMPLNEIVKKEARSRAVKWKTWYPELPFNKILKKQYSIVLNRYRHRMQQNLQRSTGVCPEPLQMISEISGGHYFHGAYGEKEPTNAKEIMEMLVFRKEVRDRLFDLKKNQLLKSKEKRKVKTKKISLNNQFRTPLI